VFPSVSESSSYLPGVLFSSQAFLVLWWTMLRTILGEVASQSGFTWRLCVPTWGSMWMSEPALEGELAEVR
jgi:hypothetical protein